MAHPAGLSKRKFPGDPRGRHREIKEPLLQGHHAGPHGLEVDIGAQHREIAALPRIRHDRLVATLEKMAAETVPRVEAHRPCGLEPAHPRNQIGLGRLQQEMVVVGHRHLRRHPPARALAHLAQGLEEATPIRGVLENRLPPVPAFENVINRPGIYHARFASHPSTLPKSLRPRQERNSRSDPFFPSPDGCDLPVVLLPAPAGAALTLGTRG